MQITSARWLVVVLIAAACQASTRAGRGAVDVTAQAAAEAATAALTPEQTTPRDATGRPDANGATDREDPTAARHAEPSDPTRAARRGDRSAATADGAPSADASGNTADGARPGDASVDRASTSASAARRGDRSAASEDGAPSADASGNTADGARPGDASVDGASTSASAPARVAKRAPARRVQPRTLLAGTVARPPVSSVSGQVTIAGKARPGVAMQLGGATARTDDAGRYTLDAPPGSGTPTASLEGWAFEARAVEGAAVNFVAVGVTLSGELPASIPVAPTVTDGYRKALATRDAPGRRWKWKLELVPPGPVVLTAQVEGFKLLLDPELSRVPLVVARRDKAGLNFIRVCDTEGTLVLGAAGDGTPVKPPITAVVSLDVRPRYWVQAPETHHMSQVNKQFVPSLLVVRSGDTVLFVNEERDTQMQHQVTAEEPNPKRFDASTRGITGQQVFTTLGVTPIHCAIHSSMHADVVVVKTPFHATTDAQGHWRIADVPEGTWSLTALEPNGGTVEQPGVKACGAPVAVRLRQKPPKPVACRPDEYECLSPVP